MKNKDFFNQYKDPRWQKKRLKILNRDNFKCVLCGEDKDTLHIHHKKYEYNTPVWEQDDKFLVTLCESCHVFETEGKNCFSVLEGVIKERFFSTDYIELGRAFLSIINKPYPPSVLSDAIERWFNTNNGMDIVLKWYFSFLKGKNKKQHKAGN